MTALSEMVIGPLVLVRTGEEREIEAETTAKAPMHGRARVYDVRGPVVRGPGLDVEIADVRFDNGDRDIRMLDRRKSRELARLESGLRIGAHLHRRSRWFVELRAPATSVRGRVTAHNCTLDELDRMCGIAVSDVLVHHGALAVGPRESAIGDRSRHRGRLCAVFAEEDSDVPAVAYVLTRIMYYSSGLAREPN